MEFAIFCLFWFFGGGVLCATIAHSRGRNPVGWFFLGAFFFLFAIIAVIALPSLKIAQPGYAGIEGGPSSSYRLPDKSCPRCAETIRGAAITCRFCDYEYPEHEAQQIEARAAEQGNRAAPISKPLGAGDRVFAMGKGNGTVVEVLGAKARVAWDRGRSETLELYWLHRA
jgi:hypothetical protein